MRQLNPWERLLRAEGLRGCPLEDVARGGARDWRIGWRLTSAAANAAGFEVSLDATRREVANDNEAEHGVMLRSLIRW